MAVKTEKVTKVFWANKPNEIKAVNGVHIQIHKGEAVLFCGPSGSGKTTLLTIISAMARPTSGDVYILGNQVSRWSEVFLTGFRRKHVGFVFQNFNLIPGLSVLDNITVPLLPTNLSRKKINNRADRILESFEIYHRKNYSVDYLSGGEMQRVAIARALISEPEILVVDEPTSNLDTKLSREVLEIFERINRSGKTIIMASHDPLVMNHSMVSTTYVMRDGQIEK